MGSKTAPLLPTTFLTADTELETHKLSMSNKTLHLLIYLIFDGFFPRLFLHFRSKCSFIALNHSGKCKKFFYT